METQRPLNLMPEFIKRAIDQSIENAIDDELKRVEERLKQRKAEMVAGVVLYVEKSMNMNRVEDNLVITIKDKSS